MKTLALLFAILTAAVHCQPVYAGMSIAPGTSAHTHSDANTGGGTLAVSGTLSSTKACAAGYTRKLPNYCARTTPPSPTSLTRDVCTAVASPDAAALMLYVMLINQPGAANAVGYRYSVINTFSDAACSLPSASGFGSGSTGVQEFVATAAGTVLNQNYRAMLVPVPAAYLKHADDGGNQGLGTYVVLGYFD